MALSKKPVNGMKDILPEEMQIRDYVQKLRFHPNRDSMYGEHRKLKQQAGW